MDGYAEYQQLLNSAIQDAQSKGFKAQQQYQGKLAEAEQLRTTIDRATEGVGDIFLVKPTEQIVKGVGKTISDKLEKSITDFSKKHFSQVSREQGETISENDVSPDVQAQRELGQSPQEGAYEEEGQQMRTYFNDNTQLETSFGRNINTTDEDTAQMLAERGRTQVGGADLNGEQQATPATEAQEGSAGDATEASSGATDALTGGETIGEVGGGAAAETGAELGAEIGLLADPFTALFGLLLGIGTIVGGVEGGKSAVKNPAIPKPPPIANVSTQFGIGSN